VAAQGSGLSGLAFDSAGLRMYVTIDSVYSVFQYSLSTAWDVSTATYDSKSKSVASEDSTPKHCRFNPSGTKMFVLGMSNSNICQYTLSTAWDISTAVYEKAHSFSDYGMFIGKNGTKVYGVSYSRENKVHQYSI
jgi:hypothetical protein